MINRYALLALAPLTLGCATVPQVEPTGATEARLGQAVNLGGPKVTVVEVLEDSRCPIKVDCVWAGRIKLSVRIEHGGTKRLAELASDQSLPVADGVLELVSTKPARSNQRAIAPDDYRFMLRFSGGL